MNLDDASYDFSIPLCSLIEDKLYLGGRDAAEDESLVKGLGITHILTADICSLEFEGNTEVKLFFLWVDDRPEEDLLSHFEKACKFIEEGCKDGGCLVHW